MADKENAFPVVAKNQEMIEADTWRLLLFGNPAG